MIANPFEYLPIINKLLEKTKEGRVQWQGALGTFSCKLGTDDAPILKFTLSSAATRDINFDARFLVMEDIKGNELFRIESNDLPTTAAEETLSSAINELYELARRQALKVGEKLELASSLLDSV